MRQSYLGDSVYIDALDYGFEIYLNNGCGRHDIILLEPEVAALLVAFITQKPDTQE